MLIGFTGFARSGKDSAANMFVERYGFTKMAFADGVREMAAGIDPHVMAAINTAEAHPILYSDLLREVGYERAKANPDVRRLLQRIGTEGVRDVLGEDTWRNLLCDKLVKLAGDNWPASGSLGNSVNVVISDVRFQNEAEFIRANGGYVIRLHRPGVGGNDTHASEANIQALPVDAIIVAEDLTGLYEELEHTRENLLNSEMVRALPVATIPRRPSIYLAAPWVKKVQAGDVKRQFQKAGIEVVSGWTEREDSPQETDPAEMVRQAGYDFAEVQQADALVILNLAKSEGKASEMGMALAQGKRVIVVGPREGNIFYHLPQVEQVDTVLDAIIALGGQPEYATSLDQALVEFPHFEPVAVSNDQFEAVVHFGDKKAEEGQ